jgi:cation:H+ antiporter
MIYLLFVLGLGLLVKGADWLVSGAGAMAGNARVSPMAIGLTIVAFGTSLPELTVNILAALKGSTSIAIGNVLGSNIANIFLILGISALIRPLQTLSNTTWKEVPYSILLAIILWVLVEDVRLGGAGSNQLTSSDGFILLAFFILFLAYTVFLIKNTGMTAPEVAEKKVSYVKAFVMIITGLVALVLGGYWIVQGAIRIAGDFGVSETLIGLTVVAVGTSLPELATSAMAAYRGQTEIAIGNVVGSNIFNTCFILSSTALIQPLSFAPENGRDLLFNFLASMVLMLALLIGHKNSLSRTKGGLLLGMYVVYLVLVSGSVSIT